jgi:phospholipase/carboxylesterase
MDPLAPRSAVAAACLLLAFSSLGTAQARHQRDGRLTARPRPAASASVPGFTALSMARERDAILFVPHAARESAVPLVVLLHGAGGSADGIRKRLFGIADTMSFALLIPDSRGPTWDAIRGIYGPDVAFIDSALKLAFSRVTIDPSRIIVSGFSDGASYALALGRINGDLFTKILAFSPGFVPPGRPTGKPEVYITHGDDDPILPYEVTSRRIVPVMQRAGYVVTLKQFAGGHGIPPEIAQEGFRWALALGAVKPAR